MTTKLGVIILALLAAWFLLVKPALGGGAAAARKRGKQGNAPPAEPTALEPCPRCGVYRVPGGRCGCDGGAASES
jgi:hypothetical protein